MIKPERCPTDVTDIEVSGEGRAGVVYPAPGVGPAMNQELIDRVLASPRLPSLPAIAIEVIELVSQPDVGIKRIAQTIQHDPALSSKILKTVNSSFYGQPKTISSVSQAIVVLGLETVRTLALGFSLVSNLRHGGGEGFDHLTFWKRSLYSAVAARAIAKTAGVAQEEEAFLGGLLQDLGMLAMAPVLGELYTELIRSAEGDFRKLFRLENETLETNHAEVGAALAESWRLPAILVEPIRHHETPRKMQGELAPLVYCVALGNHAADVFMEESPGEALRDYFKACERWLSLEPVESEPLLGDIMPHATEMRRLFDLPTGDMGHADEILARANETLLELNMSAHQRQSELQQKNQQLTVQAETDPLTGIANRGKFNAVIREGFDHAKLNGTPMSVLFLDADHFKKFNDTYGHATGDRVLIAIGKLLTEVSPERAVPCRYGGEEFSVILPGLDRRSAAKLAEEIRTAIESCPVDSDEGEPLRVTASIGVATLEDGCFERPEQLVKAADQGVYAAKAAGRNAVRVYAPRPRPKAA